MKDVVRSCIGLGAVVSLASTGCLGVDGPAGGVSGAYTELVLRDLTLPTNTTTADMLSFDLDGTGDATDNALGSVIGLLSGFDFNLQPAVSASIAGGDVVILNAIQAASLGSGPASWQVFLGNSTAAPPAFDGTDTFVRDPEGPTNAVLNGTITGGVFSGGPGNVNLSLSLGEDQPSLQIALIGARIRATVSATGATGGVLSGAITQNDVTGQIVPAIARVMTGYMLAACPCSGTGPPVCAEPNPLDDMFNTTADCVITDVELLANPLVMAGVEPDVDMFDGTAFNPGADGEPDSLSLGFGFTAVVGNFDRPGE